MDGEKLKEFFANEDYVKSLYEIADAEALQSVLEEKGVEINVEEAACVIELLTKLKAGELSLEQLENICQAAENGELSEELLENVSGGVVALITIAGILKATGIALLIGGAITGTVIGVNELIKHIRS